VLKWVAVLAHRNSNRRIFVRERAVTIPELILIGGTRVALGVGVGLLIGDKLSRDARRGAGWALLVIGALSTIPLAVGVLGKSPLIERP
jgi:hypothetical protein